MLKYILVYVILVPSAAYAYIDPGILSMLTQTIFALISTTFIAWVITPWHAVKSLFQRNGKKGKNLPTKHKNSDNE